MHQPTALSVVLGVVSIAQFAATVDAAPLPNLVLTCSDENAIGHPQNDCNGVWSYEIPMNNLIVLSGSFGSNFWVRASEIAGSDSVVVCTLPAEPGQYTSCRDEAGVRRTAFVAKDLREAALIVGNFLPPPPMPDNGILRYDGRGNFIDNMIPTGTAGNVVTCCMAFGPDENLYVSSPPTGRVLRFNGVTGEFIDVFVPAGSGSLLRPLVLLFHGGYLYVGDTEAGIIRRYDAITGAYVDDFVGLPSPASVFDLQQFAFGPDGNLYVAAEVSRQVLRYDGTSLDIFVPTSDGFSPSGMTFGPDGLLYVGSPAASEVRRYDLRTASHEVFIPAGGRLVTPVGIVFGPDGDFYATSVGTSEILRYDSTGRFVDAFVDSGEGGITGPRMITWKVKTTVCHSPGADTARAETLTIGYLSGRDHLGHGDTLGPCN